MTNMKRTPILLLLSGLLLWSLSLCAQYENIPLYYYTPSGCDISNTVCHFESGDDSGSSTVDPVDPNQVCALLVNNWLIVFENIVGDAQITVTTKDYETIVNESFNVSISIPLSKRATYIIIMKFRNGRQVVGTFHYPSLKGRKILSNGQLMIQQSDKVFSIQGAAIK